ncbi:hypothetical protein [Propionivibrio sp.]|uniref:hypothetical protein n=1 Tax=Propionivibrio sp. TaxID=2212460 RepID=UPI003BF4440D
MKSTESLDGAAKSVDLSSATGETAISGDTSIPENKRRRLVRGAAAFAPLVLTLRSGALAAASCTGLKIVNATTRGTSFPRPGRIIVPDGVVPPVPGDICVQAQVLTTCSTNPNKVETLSNLTLSNSEPVVLRSDNPNGSTTEWLSCGNPSQFVGQRIAILSSQSASSIGAA